MNVAMQKILHGLYLLTRPLSNLVLHNSTRVRVIVRCENDILLIRSSFGHQDWSLPGGGVKKNELLVAAAARELREETGVKLEAADFKEIGTAYLPRTQKWPRAHITFFFVEVTKKPALHVTRWHEIMEADWFNEAQLPEKRSPTVGEGLQLL